MVRSAFLVILFLLASCVTTANIPQEISSGIPQNAIAIALHSKQPPNALYQTVYRALATRGFNFEQENNEMGTFSTGFKEISQETTLKISVFVDESEQGSIATLRGQWGITSSMAAGISGGLGVDVSGGTANEANWKESGRPKVAFGEMAVLAHGIPHDRIEYLSQ